VKKEVKRDERKEKDAVDLLNGFAGCGVAHK
jgi:hypothetical protein